MVVSTDESRNAIRVKGYLTLRETIGDRLIELPLGGNLSLAQLLERLPLEWDPGLKATPSRRQFAILVNGCHYTHLPDRLATLLKAGDEIAIFPPIAGG